MKAATTLVLLLIFAQLLFSQTQLDSLEFIQTSIPANLLLNTFDKQLNTFNLHSFLLFDKKADNFNLMANENYNSTYIRTSDASSRDEHIFKTTDSYQFNSYFSVGLQANNNIYSDSREIDINQASLSSLLLFSQINPLDKLSIAPYAGYENNKQIGESDNGPVYGGEGILNNLTLTDFSLLSSFKFKNEDISPRRNTLRYLDFAASNNFDKDFNNTFGFQYYQNRKDFYYTADSITAAQFGIRNNIQSRTETNTLLEDRLNIDKFLNLFFLNLAGSASWKTIDRDTRYRSLLDQSTSSFDTQVDELNLALESTAGYHSDTFNGIFKINYSERDENHLTKNFPGSVESFYLERSDLESMSDNIGLRGSLSFIGDIKLSGSDSLSFSLFQSKLRYDTPSNDNYDDRDELLSIARVKYIKKLNPFFDLFINTEFTFNHIVYIYAQESSNNNINRIIKLSTGGDYSGKNISSTNIFEVSANYTVYDFEDLVPNFQSFSFRQFTAIDSSRIKLDRRLDFFHFGYLKLSEQGNLKWASFSTQPTRYLQEVYSEPKFILYYGNSSVSLGLRIYSLNTYNYTGLVKSIDSRYFSIAPLTELNFFSSNYLSFNLIGWYEFVTILGSPGKEQANLTMNVKWNF